jgi:L-threonylcarbamoyladenylate synthase
MNFIQDLKRSLEVLKNGGVILYPTDTIWGLGCDATNPVSIQKIYQIKYRHTDSKSLIILVDDVPMLERYVKTIPETASRLISVSTSPLTIIYPEGINLAEGICNEDGSVGIRVCHDIFCGELIRQFRKPLVSTSANITGQPTPSNFSEINKDIIKSVDYTVEYRQKDKQVLSASPIIKVDNNGVIKILRE